jgi:hypothetical protein
MAALPAMTPIMLSNERRLGEAPNKGFWASMPDSPSDTDDSTAVLINRPAKSWRRFVVQCKRSSQDIGDFPAAAHYGARDNQVPDSGHCGAALPELPNRRGSWGIGP